MNLPELSKSFSELKSRVEQFFSKSANAEQAEAFRSEMGILESKISDVTQLTSDLATAKQTIESLETENRALKASAEQHQAALDAKEKDVDSRASAKAATIAAAQGIPPVPIKAVDPITANSQNSVEEITRRFDAESDPRKKWELFQQLKKARGF